MSDYKRSDHSGAQPNASGRGAVPLPGTPADFAEMMSSLPDADSTAPAAERDGSPQVIAGAGIAEMFSRLPDADSASAAAPTAKRRASPPHSVGQGAPPTSMRHKPVRTAAPAPTVRPAGANELPPEVEEVLFADPPPPRSSPSRQPVAIPFNTRNRSSAGNATERGRTVVHGRTAATDRQANNVEEPADPTSG